MSNVNHLPRRMATLAWWAFAKATMLLLRVVGFAVVVLASHLLPIGFVIRDAQWLVLWGSFLVIGEFAFPRTARGAWILTLRFYWFCLRLAIYLAIVGACALVPLTIVALACSLIAASYAAMPGLVIGLAYYAVVCVIAILKTPATPSLPTRKAIAIPDQKEAHDAALAALRTLWDEEGKG